MRQREALGNQYSDLIMRSVTIWWHSVNRPHCCCCCCNSPSTRCASDGGATNRQTSLGSVLPPRLVLQAVVLPSPFVFLACFRPMIAINITHLNNKDPFMCSRLNGQNLQWLPLEARDMMLDASSTAARNPQLAVDSMVKLLRQHAGWRKLKSRTSPSCRRIGMRCRMQ